MKLTGVEKFKKLSSAQPVELYLVESYYGYGKESASSVGQYFEDEVGPLLQSNGLRISNDENPAANEIRVEKSDGSLYLFLGCRQGKSKILSNVLPALTSTTLDSKEIHEVAMLTATGKLPIR